MLGGAVELGNSVVKVVGGILIELPLRKGEITAGRQARYSGRTASRRDYVILTQCCEITNRGHLERSLTRGLGSWDVKKLLGC